MKKIVIIDGNSLLFRAFYATSYTGGPLLSTSYGTPTNAVVAFSNMLANILKTLDEGDGLFVAFDKGKNTFRHKEFEQYKANRKATPEELLVQMPIARELLKSLNIAYYESDNLEADDIAGIMAKKASKLGIKAEVYTSDHDYLQLIDDNITIELIKRGLQDIKKLDLVSFKEEYGIEPIQITDYKGLLGDSSDNLPGIPKVGEKTAINLIKEYGDLEKIIEAAPNMKSKIGESILTNQDLGRLCKKLATIQINESIPFEVEETIYQGYTLKDVSEFINRYEMNKLLTRLPKNLMLKDDSLFNIDYETIENIINLDLGNEIGIAINIDDNNYHYTTLYGLAISTTDKIYYIDVENLKNDKKLLDLLKDKNIKKSCFDIKKLKYVLDKNNIEINGLDFDLLLATYLLDSSLNCELNSVLNYYQIDISNCEEDSISLFNEGNIKLTSANAYCSLNLKNKVIFKLKEKDQLNLLYEIEQPLSLVLCDMEKEGFPADIKMFNEFKVKLTLQLEELTKKIYEVAGEEFNIASPKQLGHILYEKLGLKTNKKESTSFEFLKELVNEHPIINLILEYRKLSKQLTTYIEGIIPFIDENGLIHATFNQAITATGRLSSSEPNLQNISVRDEDNKTIRKLFHYKEDGIYILSLDYSQIELRILAHLSNSKSLIDIFKSNEDIHSATAKKVFKLDREPTSLERRKAKAVNFGIVYGISDWGLADQIETSVGEAKEIIESFYNNFPEIKTYLDSQISFAITHGYVSTIFNRRRYLESINDSNYQKREFAKRAAMNAPIQGSAADLIKIATIKVSEELKNKGYKSRLINQIHDELILKTYEDEKEEVLKLVKDIMEHAITLNVPLLVDGGYARDWYSAK